MAFAHLAIRFSMSVIALSSSLRLEKRKINAIAKRRPSAKKSLAKIMLIAPLKIANRIIGFEYVYPFTVTLPFFSLILTFIQIFILCRECCLLRSPDSKYPTKSSSV